jgi:hypothetical protein
VSRIRTIATTGIVAGSVALAAALLSSGGVGASFVDAAEASASISVADHLDGLEPSPCTFTLYLHGKEVNLGNGQLPFDLFQVAEDSENGTSTATLDFDISSPDPQAFDMQWAVTPTGDLNSTMTGSSHGISVTFWWPKPSKDHHVKGSVFITLTCTPRADHADDHDAHHSDALIRLNSTDGTDAADMSPETYSAEAVIDLPPADGSGPTCDPHDTEAAISGGCTADQPSEPDCTPGGADVADTAKCPPAAATPAISYPAAPGCGADAASDQCLPADGNTVVSGPAS